MNQWQLNGGHVASPNALTGYSMGWTLCRVLYRIFEGVQPSVEDPVKDPGLPETRKDCSSNWLKLIFNNDYAL